MLKDGSVGWHFLEYRRHSEGEYPLSGISRERLCFIRFPYFRMDSIVSIYLMQLPHHLFNVTLSFDLLLSLTSLSPVHMAASHSWNAFYGPIIKVYRPLFFIDLLSESHGNNSMVY